jgi:mono/diheme cytochrome c family protein
MKRVHAWTTTALLASMLALAPSAWAGGSGSATHSGNASAGAAVFNQTCVACHGSDGKGIMPGMPDFTQSGGVLSLPTKTLEARITDGFSDGNAPMAMPPKGNNPSLTQGDIRNVIAYLRSTFQH